MFKIKQVEVKIVIKGINFYFLKLLPAFRYIFFMKNKKVCHFNQGYTCLPAFCHCKELFGQKTVKFVPKTVNLQQ
jgi:hypothetical protein